MIYRNSPAMIVDVIPWTKRPDGAEIAAGVKRVRAARIGQSTRKEARRQRSQRLV